MSRAAGNSLRVLFVSAAVLTVAIASYGRRAVPPRPVCGVQVCGPDTVVLPRLEAKRRIVEEVIAGRRSLLDAAADFKALGRDGWPYPADSSDFVSEDEIYCRNVIVWVRWQGDQDRGKELASQFEAELDVRLREGTLRLPD